MLVKLIISWFLQARRNMLRLKLIATYWARSNKYTKGIHKNWLGNFIDYIYRQECFSGKQTTRKVHTNYIQDSSGVFSISSLVRISISSFLVFILLFLRKYSCLFAKSTLVFLKKKLTRWLEDILFSRGKKQYFTHSLRALLKNRFYNSKIKYISWRRRVISFM